MPRDIYRELLEAKGIASARNAIIDKYGGNWFTHWSRIEGFESVMRLGLQPHHPKPVTRHPTAEWLAQQILEAFPWTTAPTYLVRDNDRAYRTNRHVSSVVRRPDSHDVGAGEMQHLSRRRLAAPNASRPERPVPCIRIGPALPDRKSLDAEIARLRDLGVSELRSRWHTVFRRQPPPHLPRHLLFRVLAYRLQADQLGDLDAETVRLLDRSGSPEKAGQRAVSIGQGTAELTPGTMLGREWNGQMHRVAVLTEGFAWNGKTYRSLALMYPLSP
jgi:Protein of unknown function (DUF2924)